MLTNRKKHQQSVVHTNLTLENIFCISGEFVIAIGGLASATYVDPDEGVGDHA